MGIELPPLYGEDGVDKILKKISKIDEKINELFFERENLYNSYVKAVKNADEE